MICVVRGNVLARFEMVRREALLARKIRVPAKVKCVQENGRLSEKNTVMRVILSKVCTNIMKSPCAHTISIKNFFHEAFHPFVVDPGMIKRSGPDSRKAMYAENSRQGMGK